MMGEVGKIDFTMRGHNVWITSMECYRKRYGLAITKNSKRLEYNLS